jgi:hypothetical protein
MNIGDVVKSSEFVMHKGEFVEMFHVVAETRRDPYGDLYLRLDPPGPIPKGNQSSPDDDPDWTLACRVDAVSKVI